MRFYSTILFFLISSYSWSQLTKEQCQQLKTEVLSKINLLRTQQKISVLKFNSVLEAAAIFHSDYMASNQVFRHEEKNPKNGTPKIRVINAGGSDFELVGENIYKSTEQKFPLSKEGLSKLAVEMFDAWKKSPGHYANMIHTNYTLADFGFAVDVKTNVVYATNVFGKKGVVVSNQLSHNAFGLTKAPADCKKEYKNYTNLIYNLGNGIYIQGNDVVLQVSDNETIKKIIASEKDGFAIDVIERNQFPCNASNRLDMSPIYDGILLKPIYKKELFAKDVAESNYRFVANLGEIPAYLRGKELDIRLLIIRNGQVCMQINQGGIDSDRYNLTPVTPTLYVPSNVTYGSEGIIRSEELIFNFNPKDTIPSVISKLAVSDQKIHSVFIQSYSSIDGDSLSNAYYHYMRGKWIERHITKSYGVTSDKLKLDYKENWELMEFQMRYYFANDLLLLPHDSIRKYYKLVNDIPWKKLFAAQRRSTATVNFFGKLPEGSTNIKYARLNLPTALINKDWELTNKCLAEFYVNKEFPTIILANPFFEIIKNEPGLVQNIAAIYYQNGIFDLESETQFLFAALQHAEKLSLEAKENLALLYAKLSYDLLGVWDLPSQQLANVIKPQDVLEVIQGIQFRPEVMANVHLTFIDYYGQINDARNISISFDFISNYYKDKIMDLKDEIRLCLFFNRWSRYDLTIAHLLPKYKEKKLDEFGTFLLARTMVFYPESDQKVSNEVLFAASIYKNAWCKWLNKEFFLFENEEVKLKFCNTCK